MIWDETKHVLRTYVHLAFAKLTEDEDLQREFYSLPDDVQHAYVEFFKSISTFSETVQVSLPPVMQYLHQQNNCRFKNVPNELDTILINVMVMSGCPRWSLLGICSTAKNAWKSSMELRNIIRRPRDCEETCQSRNFAGESSGPLFFEVC